MVTKSNAGRPTKYKAEYVEQARKLALLGLTDVEMADVFGVTEAEFAFWAWENESFFNAITPTDSEKADWALRLTQKKEKRAKFKRGQLQNPHHRIANSMRARMWAALKGKTSGHSLSRLGYSIEDLVLHLESSFAPGMNWENYGKWHVDHIKPCALFDLTNPCDFEKCWAISNLQPLWASENVKKGANYASA